MASVRTRPLIIALVAILAIALAAATLNTAVSHGSSTGSEGGGGLFGAERPESGTDRESSSFGFQGFGGAFPVIPFPCYPFLNEWRFFAGVAIVGGVGLYLLYRWKGPLVPYAVVAALAPPGLLIHALFTACREAEEIRLTLPLANQTVNTSGSFTLIGSTGSGGTPVVTIGLVVLLGLALLVAVALLLVSTGDDAPPPSSAPAAPDPEQMQAIGRSAGRAADRIERDVDPDNAIYRAWKEMTDLLEVPNPAASTPAEFATAAVEAGMDPDDIDELTSLFESVRYGPKQPTEARETRAVAALRRIEADYAGESA